MFITKIPSAQCHFLPAPGWTNHFACLTGLFTELNLPPESVLLLRNRVAGEHTISFPTLRFVAGDTGVYLVLGLLKTLRHLVCSPLTY